jgi:hypothetical protein
MGQTECSETSVYKIQTPGNYPEENIQHSGKMRKFEIKIPINFGMGTLYWKLRKKIKCRSNYLHEAQTDCLSDTKKKKFNYRAKMVGSMDWNAWIFCLGYTLNRRTKEVACLARRVSSCLSISRRVRHRGTPVILKSNHKLQCWKVIYKAEQDLKR